MSTKRKKAQEVVASEVLDVPEEQEKDLDRKKKKEDQNDDSSLYLTLDISPTSKTRRNNSLILQLQIISLLLHSSEGQGAHSLSLLPQHILESFNSLQYRKEDVMLLYTHVKNNPYENLSTIPHLFTLLKAIGIEGAGVHVHLFICFKKGKITHFIEINNDLFGFHSDDGNSGGDEYYMLDCNRRLRDVSQRFLDINKYYQKKKIPFIKDFSDDCWSMREEQENEVPFPKSISSFKKHTVYSLDSLLTSTQALRPNSKILGIFNGSHSIIFRKDISTLKSEKGWWINYGKVVRKDVEKKPYYGEWETEPYIPEPLGPNNQIPTNHFGNVDLFRGDPSFIPANTSFIEDRLAGRVCKMLKASEGSDFNWAPACVGFKFGGRQPHPILRGAIVPTCYATKVNDLIIRMRIKNTVVPYRNESNTKRCKQYKLIIEDDSSKSFNDFFP